MDLESIRLHWQDWARRYGTDLRATTKGSTAKIMEIDALRRAMIRISEELGGELKVMEAGCGNGKNCLNLVDDLPQAFFTGFDFIPEMIDAANAVKQERADAGERLEFFVEDILKVSLPIESYDIVFTDRCIINLNTEDLQQQAVLSLIKSIKPGGYLLLIENSQQTYSKQNLARESVGLPSRTPDVFNRFIDETTFLPFLTGNGLELVGVEDFISLHDIVLYVLVPMINGGTVDYTHPLVSAATQLNASLSAIEPSGVGAWGQNRLYKCRKIK